MISSATFRKRFIILILLSWTVPAVFGLSFLIYIEMFTPTQMWDILTSPIEPVFVLIAIFSAHKYFSRFNNKVCAFLDEPERNNEHEILLQIQKFPLHFWMVFLLYLLVAPITVIYSAEIYSDFVATPIDWFRINLVALIVSIIVGLPIFISIMDLFGKITSQIIVNKPIVSIKTKVFLIGALVPLLIDTMLIQYYWTRTQYFTYETFFVWLMLELLAIAGSLIFVKSFSQSLAPLSEVVSQLEFEPENIDNLRPQSTDELGILTVKYNLLLRELHNEKLHLEEKVTQRTAELAEANQELKAFSYSVSHDLRAPLRHIISFSQILKDEHSNQINQETKAYLDRICASSERLSSIIDQMLRLSRIREQDIAYEPVDLSLFASYQIELLQNTEPERKVITKIEPNLEVQGDNHLLMILMENLINNAWKYTSKKTETIIEFGFDKAQNAFFLRDNGAGFNMDYANKLFEPFQRLHNEREFEGSGVGLATVYRIIKKHNGKIWAESQLNNGATFYFQL